MIGPDAFESVLAAAQTGAEWAFERLYVEYNPRLERYFGGRSPAAGEDLTAETWISAARGLAGFEGDETKFRSWLFTIAHRRLVDHIRQRAGVPEPVDPASVTGGEGGVEPEASVVESMSGREAALRITRVLPPDQAEVVLLRVLGELDVAQVAEIVGKRPGAVRALQHRALRKLKEEFSLEGITE